MIHKVLNNLQKKYNVDLSTLSIHDVRVGVYMTMVVLSNGNVGLASTMMKTTDKNYRYRRDKSPFSTGDIIGNSLDTLFVKEEVSPLKTTLKVACLNAVSQSFLNSNNYSILENVDPISLIDFRVKKRVVMIGAFKSYMEKLANSIHDFVVLEMRQSAIPDQFQDFYRPAQDAEIVLPIAEVVIVTGFTIVNNTILDLLEMIPPLAQVIVVGPSSSFVPDVLFEKGVDILAMTRIDDKESIFNIIAQGGTGFHLFRNGASKICVLNE